jgi:ribosome-binding factor A
VSARPNARVFAQQRSFALKHGFLSDVRTERKTRQFCRQVQRALHLALADQHDDDLNDLFIEDVSPAPDSGHLLVSVVIPADRHVGDVLAALRRQAPRLRSEVAAAITRKRAPELSFVPAFPGGGSDGGDHA